MHVRLSACSVRDSPVRHYHRGACADNYGEYRKAVALVQSNLPYLPPIPVLCRYVSSIRMGVPSFLGTGILNLDKMLHVSAGPTPC